MSARVGIGAQSQGMTEREFLVQEEMALTCAILALTEAQGAAHALSIAPIHQGLITKLGLLRDECRYRFRGLEVRS